MRYLWRIPPFDSAEWIGRYGGLLELLATEASHDQVDDPQTADFEVYVAAALMDVPSWVPWRIKYAGRFLDSAKSVFLLMPRPRGAPWFAVSWRTPTSPGGSHALCDGPDDVISEFRAFLDEIEDPPRDNFEVALSFAGQDRAFVEEVASVLRAHRVKVFYDRFREASLWGEDLYQMLTAIYSAADFTVVFISKHYAVNRWPKHELAAAQARAFQESQRSILPARFDATELPGMLPTMGYVDLTRFTPNAFAHLILDKLGRGPTLEPDPRTLRNLRIGYIVQGCRDASVQAQPDLRAEQRRLVNDAYRAVVVEESIVLGRPRSRVADDIFYEVLLHFDLSDRAIDVLAWAAAGAARSDSS